MYMCLVWFYIILLAGSTVVSIKHWTSVRLSVCPSVCPMAYDQTDSLGEALV